MSGPTGAVKGFSVPSFTLKTDMSPAGDVAKAKEPEKAPAKATVDSFEPAAKAREALDTLRSLVQQGSTGDEPFCW